MSTVCEPLIIHLMESLSMAPSSVQAVVDFRGVEVVAGSLGAAEGSVVGGSNAWGPRWNPWGSTFFLKVDPLYSH